MDTLLLPLAQALSSLLNSSAMKLSANAIAASMPLLSREMLSERATCLSCSSPCSTNSCQTNTPGGLFLQTQFWDYNPATGPSNSWTIHGLWPDNCDGSYVSNCDSSRNENDIGSVLQSRGATSTLDYMNDYWVDINGDNSQFWSHEWDTHGTCVTTLEPQCYSSYQSGQDIVDFFTTTVNLFKKYNVYSALSQAGITPSSSKTYTLSALQNAAKNAYGQYPNFRCRSGNLNEAWFNFETSGRSTTSGAFTLVAPLSKNTNCPSSGIKYNPKSG